MSSLDTLPGDQRAVLQLVLGRGRSYEEIAGLLSINPDSVRDRARAALDTLGPQTGVAPEDRARIGDYLLGQLPAEHVDDARGLIAGSPRARAWARVLSSELAPLAGGPLPEIPVDAAQAEPASAAAEGGPRSSRLGGMIVIAVGVIVVIVVLVIILNSGGSGTPKQGAVTISTTSTTTPAASSTTTPAASSTTTPAASGSSTADATSTATTGAAAGSSTTTSATTGAKVVAQVNLTPTAAGSKAAGIAEVLREGTTDGIAIVAQNIPPNSTYPPDAYAVWLYNSPTDAHILGFVNPGVGANQRLSTAGGLPGNAAHYKQLIVTLETTGTPKSPGAVVLRGALPAL